MTLLITMLPIYLLGNLHCFGMCGPLVMMLGKHRYRLFYFFGRLLSFSLTGMLAGGAGAILHVLLTAYHIPALTSLLFGGVILLSGLAMVFSWRLPAIAWVDQKIAPIHRSFSILMLKDAPLPTFLFGFFTVFLPCGQSMIVFSACALSASSSIGLLNGFVFALLTTPSLLFALYAHRLLGRFKRHYNTVLGFSAILVGALAICRGCAEMQLIEHKTLNPNAPEHYRIVLF